MFLCLNYANSGLSWLTLLCYIAARYDNIFTSNGVSLHELAMKISKDMELSERETDDLCRECGQGGDIFPCKICPRSFHPGSFASPWN
jgi:hypothetical protein